MDYSRALAAAVDAAREAGAILRGDFGLPGGAPGNGRDHADADVRAERLIVERLRAAFPQWGGLCEETGRFGGDGEHVWLVDPNDGTAAYLRGQRGAAVSIALVRRGVPVLGVVYAHTAPDHVGDLFAWAEGTGPLRRNGIEVSAPRWPAELASSDVVLVSGAADSIPHENAALVSPARYLAVPSIAWRLACVAAGDGVAAVSLNGPCSWDFAAGHALLLAMGGELVDQAGRPVVYTPDGTSHTARCFGGAPSVVRELARRDWQEIGSGRRFKPEPWDLVQLEKGRNVASTGVLSRAQGCLLGQLAGDSLGSLVEFRGPESIAAQYPGGLRDLADGGTWDTLAGQPTDDSEMALMLARSIVRGRGYDAEQAAQAYYSWYASRPFDIGGTTSRALSAMNEAVCASGGAAEAASQAADPKSQANGSLMRASPLGVYGHAFEPAALAALARADSGLTHPNPVCRDACAVFTVAIAFAVRSGETPRAVFDYALAFARDAGLEASVVGSLERADEAPPPRFTEKQGWVLIALQNAFHRLRHAKGVEDGVVATVAAGGDTDTNGAIAGALLGAVYGRDGVPEAWRRQVLTCRPLRLPTWAPAPQPARRSLLTSSVAAPNPSRRLGWRASPGSIPPAVRGSRPRSWRPSPRSRPSSSISSRIARTRRLSSLPVSASLTGPAAWWSTPISPRRLA